jgi:predicted ester cyclase
MKTYRASNPDMKANGKVMLVDGDWVCGVAMVNGTNTGDMGPGMPATNKAWEATGIDVIRFENGKAVEQWTLFDVMKMMTDLGVNMGGGGMDSTHAHTDTTAVKK